MTAVVQYFFVTLAALALLAGCAGSGTVSEGSAPLVIVDETLPLPKEGERLNMRAIKRISRLAKSESLLVARHERNQLLLADIDASTLVAIDSQLAWFSGDVILADQLLEKLARDNTAALDYVLSEQEQRSALTGDWLTAAKRLFHLSRRGSAGRQSDTVSDQLFAYLLRLDSAILHEQLQDTESPDWRRWLAMQVAYRQGAIRANAFGMKCIGYDLYWPEEFAAEHKVERMDGVTQLLRESDIVSLHTNLTDETRDMICEDSIKNMKDGAVLINCGRGELTNSADIAAALEREKLSGYGADVLDQEPPPSDHPLLGAKNCIITPHVGSRTYESVQRQAGMATQNLVNLLKGEKALAQVNDVPAPEALL